MENNRRTFLKSGGVMGIAVACMGSPLASLFRGAVAPMRGVLSISTPALRASWPQVARLTLQIARQNAAKGVAGASLAVAAALRSLHRATGKPWYDPVFRPSLRSPVTGQVR